MITYPGERCVSNTAASGASTEVLTISSDCSNGNTLILSFASRCTSTSGITITDSKGNTWTVDIAANTGNNMILLASCRQDVATLLAGDTVTMNFTTVPNGGRMTTIEEVSNLLTASYGDGSASNSTGAATSLTAGNITTTNAADLIVAAWCVNSITSCNFNASGTVGTYSNFTTSSQNINSGGFQKFQATCYQIAAATGTKTAAISWTGSQGAQGVSMAYKASGNSNPSVTTAAASDISKTQITGNGNVTSDGGSTITERGFVWSTSANPTTSDNKVTVAGTTGSLTGTVSGLSPKTSYHYRAYATNAGATSYGSDKTFTTSPISGGLTLLGVG